MQVTTFQVEALRLVERLWAELERREGDNLVSFVVFGSVARGEAAPGSDVDLLLVFRALPTSRAERFRIFYDAREALRQKTKDGGLEAAGHPFDWSPVILTMEEARYHSPLYLDLVEDARLLLDRGGFFVQVLDGLRARMRELGSRRVRLPGGSWYWDLKPDWKPGEVIEL
ncbi:MAG: nucleotidyltransferase domain-containing protein [Myxococcales bacterium]|nr:nucleotidyltransferase domain-containing protein [Myxococcales bacterium]